MLDDRADSNGHDLPFTGRHSLSSLDDPWQDLARAVRRETRRGLTRHEITIAILVAIGFLILAVRVAADVSPHDPPPATVYHAPTPTTPPAGW